MTNLTPSGEDSSGKRKPLINKRWCPPPTATDICKCGQPEGRQVYSSGTLTHQFPYRDLNGARLFSRFRYRVSDKASPEYPKTFRYCVHYEKNNPVHQAALYGLPKIAEAKAQHIPKIYLVEGESDAEAAFERGMYASTAHTGTRFYVEMAEHYAGYDGIVYIVVDRDHLDPKHQQAFKEDGRDYPGAASGLKRWRALRKVGVKAFFRESTHRKDLRDHFSNGGTAETLEKISLEEIKLRAPKEAGLKEVSCIKLQDGELPEGPGMLNFIQALEHNGYLVIPLGEGRYKTNCPHPEHDDRNPSFEFQQGDEGVKAFCFSRDCSDKRSNPEGWREICDNLDIPQSATFDDTASGYADDGDERVDVTNSSRATNWLRENLGTGQMSGFFTRGGVIVHTPRIGEKGYIPLKHKHEADEDSEAQVRFATADIISASVHLEIGCFKLKMDRDGNVKKDDSGKAKKEDARFPETAAKDIVSRPDMAPNVQPIMGVVHVPTFRPNGSLIEEPGYDEATGLLYLPRGLDIEKVPERPTTEQVKQAVDLICTPIAKFDFITPHDKANYLGALFTPLLRTLLPPPYKFILIEAHQRGSGKTKLAKMVIAVHGGVFRVELPEDDAEMRKQFSSILATTTGGVVVFDNLSGILRSSTFAGILTAKTIGDRTLGKTRMERWPNDRLWMGTGNNVAVGGDIPRRTIRVRIDPGVPEPEKRTFAFDPERWATSHRAAILHALLTIVRGWISAGMEKAPLTGSDDYADWTQGINGILKFAGIAGTFDHSDTVVKANVDEDDWSSLLEALHDKFGEGKFKVSDVADKLAPGHISLDDAVKGGYISPEVLPAGLLADFEKAGTMNTSIRKKLGNGFMRNERKWFGRFCVVLVDKNSKKGNSFRIETYTPNEEQG